VRYAGYFKGTSWGPSRKERRSGDNIVKVAVGMIAGTGAGRVGHAAAVIGSASLLFIDGYGTATYAARGAGRSSASMI
jgi:hypothetical protein